MGVKMLYLVPFANRIVELVEKFPDASAAVRAGVSSCPSE